MTELVTSRHRNLAPWPKDALRIAFGVIWALDAALKWTPGFRSGYLSYLTDGAKGQPAWLHPWFSFWIDSQRPHPVFFAYLAAAVETLIAAALILGVARKLTYIAAAVFSFLIWSTAEGFGGPYTAGSTDVGASVIYVVVFLGLLALSYYTGSSRHSVDYWLEGRISWWWKLAEVRRPAAIGHVSGPPPPPPSPKLGG
ncbi:MAG: DoxX family protein [Actinomycetota bacterium]|nr:DoxX family protein [Actinomycetota bacterium]